MIWGIVIGSGVLALVVFITGGLCGGREANRDKERWRSAALENAVLARKALKKCWEWEQWHEGQSPLRIDGSGDDRQPKRNNP